ncbi:MAG: WD40 repeat domain-containing protein [Anaerolineales bacterium]|nr:WD40 repeat domain-containing protein [Anaerolineales bacterium]
MPEPIVFQAHDNYVLALQFSHDGNTLISGGMDSLIRMWSVPGWEQVRIVEGHEHSVNTLALSPGGDYFISGSTDGTVRRWSFPGGDLLNTYRDRKKTVAAARISADGNWVAGAYYGGRAAVWALDGETVAQIPASKKNLGGIAFSPDGRLIALSGLGDDITLWSLPEGELLGSLEGHSTAVTHLEFMAEGAQLISLGYDQSIRFWDTSSWELIRAVQSDKPGVRGLLLNQDESLAALALEGLIQHFRVSDWSLAREIQAGAKVVSSMAFSPDGNLFVTGGADKKIRVWELN